MKITKNGESVLVFDTLPISIAYVRQEFNKYFPHPDIIAMSDDVYNKYLEVIKGYPNVESKGVTFRGVPVVKLKSLELI